MHGFDGMHHSSRAASTVEGGGNFVTDVPVFSNAGDHNFSITLDGLDKGLDGGVKGVVELLANRGDAVLFDG